MLKKSITYTDFNDNEVTEIFYFNLSKPELVELEVEVEGGLGELLQKIVETVNKKELIKYFKMFILMSIGEKSDDGKRFIKSDEIKHNFEQHAAYEKLFMELSTDDNAAAEFINGIMPADLAEIVNQDKPTGPPPSPSSPPPFNPGQQPLPPTNL
jgi:hypothetical protein